LDTLGIRFIRNYATITAPLEQLFKKSKAFIWTLECDKAFAILKDKIVIAPILAFLNWNLEFHIHVYASGIALGVVLTQPREGYFDHPIYFSSQKLS